MISRRTANTIAEAYESAFSRTDYGGVKDNFPLFGPIDKALKKIYELLTDKLYDFLYKADYDRKFLDAISVLPPAIPGSLKKFIMQLHTGESLKDITRELSWEEREKMGQGYLERLAEDILQYSDERGASKHITKELRAKLIAELELGGYLYKNGKLHHSEAAVFDTQEEEGVLQHLIRELVLENSQTMFHHLRLSEQHFLDERWDDSISNSRKFLESVLQEIAARHHEVKYGVPLDQQVYDRPVKVRDYLEQQGLIETKEKEAISSVYGLLSGTGGHPYIAERDQARLMRHLALTFSQFVMLRLQGFLQKD